MVVVTLALGIGANSAIFSAVDAVLLRPLPYSDADRLVAVYERNLARPQATQLLAPGRLEEWNAQNHTFAGLAASYFENMTDTTGPMPERVAAMRTSPRFFTVLGVAPALGRTPTAEEERFGGPAVAVVSDAFWRTRLDADPAVIGRRLVLGGAAVTVVGVMPPSFQYPTAATEVWVPTRAPQFFLQARSARLYTAFGRLQPGVTPEQAVHDLTAVQTQLGARYPDTDRGWGAAIVPLKEEQVGGVRRSLWLLLAAVTLVLLAACGNVACLLLADATRREREIAVRIALGADRLTVLRQLMTEGLLLAACGGAAGLVVAGVGTNALRTMANQVPRIAAIRLDIRLVWLTLAIAAASTVAFALAPALHMAHVDPAPALAATGPRHSGRRRLLQGMLAAGQMALAVVLLVSAGLLIRSFQRLQAVSPGFDQASVVTFRMSAQWSERPGVVVQRHARTLERLRALAGVEAAALSQLPPASLLIPPGEFHIVGRREDEKTFAAARSVSAGYFRTLHIPLLTGTTCSEDPAAPPYSSALVTRAFVDRYLPEGDAVGHALTTPGLPPGTQATIRGVVGDVRENGVMKAPEPLIYWCGYNGYWPDPYFLVRTTFERPATLNDIRAGLREIEPARAMYAVRPLADLLAESTSQQRVNTILLTLFGAAALALASLGLYGVLSQLVAARQREIGVRLAVGARPADIMRLVLAHAGALTGAGAAIGLAAAFGGAQLMSGLVFGIAPRDPVTFVVAPLLLAIAAVAAAAIPATRAASTDPVHALRAE